jgi:hypothetical protein
VAKYAGEAIDARGERRDEPMEGFYSKDSRRACCQCCGRVCPEGTQLPLPLAHVGTAIKVNPQFHVFVHSHFMNKEKWLLYVSKRAYTKPLFPLLNNASESVLAHCPRYNAHLRRSCQL